MFYALSDPVQTTHLRSSSVLFQLVKADFFKLNAILSIKFYKFCTFLLYFVLQ